MTNRRSFLQAANCLDRGEGRARDGKANRTRTWLPRPTSPSARILIVRVAFQCGRAQSSGAGPMTMKVVTMGLRRRRPRRGQPRGSGCSAQAPRWTVGAASRYPPCRGLRVSWHEPPGLRVLSQGLQKAVDRDAPADPFQLWSWQVELRVSPFMALLHDDPRWQALLVQPEIGSVSQLVPSALARRALRSPVVSPS